MKKLYQALLLISAPFAMQAQITLVKDINQKETSILDSYPSSFMAGNGMLFFTATNEFGGELWKTNGTPEGTVLVKDIREGGQSSNVTPMGVINGTLFFSASDGTHGHELWKSDGTADGTVMVKDIREGASSSEIQFGRVLGNILVFRATTIDGIELWKSDGTEAGTVLLKDIVPGPESSHPNHLTVSGNLLFFMATTLAAGYELWVTDGTTAGTVITKDIRPGSTSSNPNYLVDMGGNLYFAASDPGGTNLWKSDGTEGGTVIVKDFPGVGDPYEIVAAGSQLFFSCNSPGGRELWKSDGTDAGTFQVKDLEPGAVGSNPERFTVAGTTLFFRASTGAEGTELWKSDGTDAGTVLVNDILTGSSSGYPEGITAFNNKVVFMANSDEGQELWISDGTLSGTQLVKDINQGSASGSPQYMAAFNNKVYFQATDGINGYELWSSDGTGPGTMMLKDISTIGNDGADIEEVTAFNGLVFFSANDGIHGSELWKSDGTDAGTSMLKDIDQGAADGVDEPDIAATQQKVYFTASDGTNGEELWATDGTAEGTVMVKDIVPGPDGPNIYELIAVNEKVFFVANTDDEGSEVWVSDGTSAGTHLVKDIRPGNDASYPSYLCSIGDDVFFLANDGVNGVGLWKSDGTLAGTELVKGSSPGDPFSTDIGYLTNVGGTLFFRANSTAHGPELWKSDGTTAGTVMVKDINPGVGTSNVAGFVAANGLVFFVAKDDSHGYELWKSDGTDAGTVMVKDIATGSNPDSSPGNITLVDNLVFFNAQDSGGPALWKTDGTEAGTEKIANTASSLYGFVSAASKLFFLSDGLWVSDGTTTMLLQTDGYISSAPVVMGRRLFLTMSHPMTSDELFVYEIPLDAQTISFSLLSAKTVGDVPFQLSATSSSNLAVTFSSNSPAISLSGTQATILSAGRVTITASQSGNDQYLPAQSAVQSFCIKPAKPAILSNPAATILTSSASAGNQWYRDGSPVSGATGSVLNVSLNGTYTVATKADDCESEMSLPVVINKQAQTISFDVVSDRVVTELPFTLPVTATSGLPVVLNSSSPAVTLSGNLVTIVQPGRATIVASQAGDASFYTAVPVERSFCVKPARPVISSTAATILTSSASAGNQWYLDGVPVPGATGAVLNVSLNGTYSVATKADDCESEVSLPVVINKQAQTISFDVVPDRVVTELPFTLPATATSGLPVVLTSSSPAVTLSGNLVTIVQAGHATIVASQPGDDSFHAADPIEQSFCINPLTPTISIDADNNLLTASDDYEHQWYLNGSVITGQSGKTLSISTVGTYNVRSTKDGCQSALSATAVISLKSQSITFESIGDHALTDPAFILSASATSGLPVSFATNSDKVTMSGKNVSLLKPGRVSITASQPGSLLYGEAPPVERTFCILPPTPTISVGNVAAGHPVLQSSSSAGNQWLLNGAVLTGATSQTLTVEQEGEYTVTVSVDGCKSAPSDDVAMVVTEVQRGDTGVSVFPNPVEDRLTVSLPGGNARMILLQHDGKVVYSLSTDETNVSLDMASFAAGLYLLRTVTTQGEEVTRIVRK